MSLIRPNDHKLGDKSTTPCIDYGGSRKRAVRCRELWEDKHGPIPEGLWLLHKCDNARCWNIDHFFLGTNSENVIDSIIKGIHGKVKLTPSLIIEIRKEKGTNNEIALKYGVTGGTIRRIIKGETWKFIQ